MNVLRVIGIVVAVLLLIALGLLILQAVLPLLALAALMWFVIKIVKIRANRPVPAEPEPHYSGPRFR